MAAATGKGMQTKRKTEHMASHGRSVAEVELLAQIIKAGFPVPEVPPETRFHPTRKWMVDFLWRDAKIILEYEGGTFMRCGKSGALTGGRHQHPVSFGKDCEKYNAAALLGYIVLRVVPAMVKDGSWRDLLDSAFELAQARSLQSTAVS